MDQEERRIRDQYLGTPEYYRKLQEYKVRTGAAPACPQSVTCAKPCERQETQPAVSSQARDTQVRRARSTRVAAVPQRSVLPEGSLPEAPFSETPRPGRTDYYRRLYEQQIRQGTALPSAGDIPSQQGAPSERPHPGSSLSAEEGI